MGDETQADWTLDQHLSAGTAALALIAVEHKHRIAQPVCHHFSELAPVDPMAVSVTETYKHLCPAFAALGLEFLPDRLEAWESTRPDQSWLVGRIPAAIDLARSSGLTYQGWTWEPRGQQPLGAIDFVIANNRSD